MIEYSIHLIDGSKLVVEADGYDGKGNPMLAFYLMDGGAGNGGSKIIQYTIPVSSILYIQTSYKAWRDEIQRRRDEAMTNITMYVSTPEEDSLLIELISKHWRVGLSLEKDASESSWYCVSDDTLGRVMESGIIAERQREMIADFLRDWEPRAGGG